MAVRRGLCLPRRLERGVLMAHHRSAGAGRQALSGDIVGVRADRPLGKPLTGQFAVIALDEARLIFTPPPRFAAVPRVPIRLCNTRIRIRRALLPCRPRRSTILFALGGLPRSAFGRMTFATRGSDTAPAPPVRLPT